MSDEPTPDGATLIDAPGPETATRRRRRLDLSGLLGEPEDPRERTRELGAVMGAVAAVPVSGAFGAYQIEGPLGEGGMARLSRARAPDGTPCVIKTVRADAPAILGLFRREMQVARRLDHPHVVRALDVGTVDGVDFLALELVDGPSLRAVLDQEGELPLGVALEVARDLARALAYIHALTDEAGASLALVHRDVSPENVLLSHDGRARLADFGIAWFHGREDPTRLGVLRGKPRYMAPEQLSGAPVDRRTDLFALGQVIDEMLAGRSAPPAIEALRARLLDPDPQQRPQDASAVLAVLERVAVGPGIAAYLAPPADDGVLAASMSGEHFSALAGTLTDGGPSPERTQPLEGGLHSDATITRVAEVASSPDASVSDASVTEVKARPAAVGAPTPARWAVAAALLLAGVALVMATLVLAGIL